MTLTEIVGIPQGLPLPKLGYGLRTHPKMRERAVASMEHRGTIKVSAAKLTKATGLLNTSLYFTIGQLRCSKSFLTILSAVTAAG